MYIRPLLRIACGSLVAASGVACIDTYTPAIETDANTSDASDSTLGAPTSSGGSSEDTSEPVTATSDGATATTSDTAATTVPGTTSATGTGTTGPGTSTGVSDSHTSSSASTDATTGDATETTDGLTPCEHYCPDDGLCPADALLAELQDADGFVCAPGPCGCADGDQVCAQLVEDGLLELHECPTLNDVDASPVCALSNQIGQGQDAYTVLHCLLICDTNNGDGDCPPALQCTDIMQMGLGVCAHP